MLAESRECATVLGLASCGVEATDLLKAKHATLLEANHATCMRGWVHVYLECMQVKSGLSPEGELNIGLLSLQVLCMSRFDLA